jgi:hypothetical protein
MRFGLRSRPVFTNPVHLDVKPASRKLTPNIPKSLVCGKSGSNGAVAASNVTMSVGSGWTMRRGCLSLRWCCSERLQVGSRPDGRRVLIRRFCCAKSRAQRSKHKNRPALKATSSLGGRLFQVIILRKFTSIIHSFEGLLG